MKIGILGFGVVGRALSEYYQQEHEVYSYDPKFDRPSALDVLNEKCEVVFICVGTPYDCENGGLDCSQVKAAVDGLTGEKTVIIKSTVMPGTTDEIQAAYPKHRVFFVPEFLSEMTAAEDYANPRRPHVVGVTWEAGHKPIGALWWLSLLPGSVSKDFPGFGVWEGKDEGATPIYVLPARQVELLKLGTNAFYAMKVTFANQLYDAGMTQEGLDALAADPWIAESHFKVEHKGYRGYGGKCLVKDTKALAEHIGYSDDNIGEATWYKYPASLCQFIDDCNNGRLESQGVDINQWL